jgi:serine/threonine protein kinase
MLPDRIVDHLRCVIDAPDLEGTRYEVIGEIGRGGMGIVYLAQDHVLGRRVALKVLNSPWEARTLASLEHPGIVPVHDAGMLPDGRSYYAMKFVEGTRLDAFRGTAPPLADRLRIFVRICEPVAFAHSHNVIHRDLKPDNVILGAFGEVLVLDWGAAERVDAVASTIAGTRGYMPPEQLAGVTDARTDIYSLGKLLAYLLNSPDPKQLHAIAAKASDSEPKLRYSSVTELAEDVVRFLDGQAVAAYRESFVESAARWISRNRTLVALILAYVLTRSVIFFLARR